MKLWKDPLKFLTFSSCFLLICLVLSVVSFSEPTNARTLSRRHNGLMSAEPIRAVGLDRAASIASFTLKKREFYVSSYLYDGITVEGSVSAVLMILSGLIICFFGHRFLKTALFFAGFYLGCIIGYSIINHTNNDLPLWGQLLIIFAIGLVFALISFFLYKVGLTILGGLCGLSVALFINSWKTGGLIQVEWGLILFLCLMVLAGIILIFWLERPLIIVSTAVLGAFLTMMGIDFFARTGYAENMMIVFSDILHGTDFTSTVAALLGVQVALTAIGIVFQYVQYYHRQKSKGKF